MASDTHSDPLFLVTGAGGKTGQRVAARLEAKGARVRAVSRRTEPRFDWDDRSTWAAALADIDAIYVSYQPDLAVPGAVENITAFFAQAKAAGARKAVLLSGRGEREAEDGEQALIKSGLDWTVIRAAWFHQNFSEAFLLDPILSGTVALPENLAAEPFVDVEDIAEIAVEALTDTRHNGRLYEVTGPEVMTFEDATARIAKATGRPIDYVSIPAPAFRSALEGEGVPAGEVDLYMYLFTSILDGRNSHVSHGVREALGREPARFDDYVARTIASGVWSGGATQAA